MANSRPGVSCAVNKLCVHYASIKHVIVSNCPFSSIHDLFIVTMESPHLKRCPESCPMHCASCLVMWYGECVCCGASMYEVAGILLARKYWWLSSFVAIKHQKNSYSTVGTEIKVSALSPLL